MAWHSIFTPMSLPGSCRYHMNCLVLASIPLNESDEDGSDRACVRAVVDGDEKERGAFRPKGVAAMTEGSASREVAVAHKGGLEEESSRG